MTSDTSLKRFHFNFIASLALLGVATLYPLSSGRADTAGCVNVGANNADLTKLINSYGQKDFKNPPEVTPTSEATRLELKVDYATIDVTGCTTHLRTYNGGIVGPTIRAKPGDTIHVRLINNLKEPGGTTPTPQQPTPTGHGGHDFNFNITNLHTHGLHVSPQGPVVNGRVPFESDNVMIEIRPQQTQDYRFVIPKDHPAGTFWYHAHVHGSTAMQLASGMEGALILDGGTKDNGELNTVPVIGKNKASEKIFVMQQLQYNKDGTLEEFATLQNINRPTLINGQLVPVIHMRPGEVQRWRFIHGGIQENVALALDGHLLHEVAADGISLGRSVPWAATPTPAANPNLAKPNNLFFFPGYRSDVLVQAKKTGGRIFLRKLDLPAPVSIQLQQLAFARAAAAPAAAKKKALAVPPVNPNDFTPGQILAELVVEGDPVADQLPTEAELKDVVPTELVDIKPKDLNGQPQTVAFSTGYATCNAVDGSCVPCSTPGPNCIWSYQVNSAQYANSPKNPVLPKLNTAATWTVSTNTGFHPFHIHVNPFQVDRKEPGPTGAMVIRSVWKDTLAAVPTKQILRTRYTEFIGTFVMHCHILTHEDQGMMEVVQIVK
jgi:FtsP/CotA-like multicopper oxidase with cupredoxin domain